MSKQSRRNNPANKALVRNVGAYVRSRLEHRSEHAKQTSPVLAAFVRAFGEKQ